jgi:DNA polymerase III subunit delta'
VFTLVLGQERVKQILQGLVTTRRIANSYIFAGPEQCGKTTMARQFIEVLGVTASVDHYEVVAEKSLKIEQIRDLKQYVQYGPHESPYLAVIVQNAETMKIEAANCFLKLLEEPPPNVFFILETNNIDQLLPTIRSRSQLIQFDQLSTQHIAQLLCRKYPEHADEAAYAAKFSGGLLAQAELVLHNLEYVRLLTGALERPLDFVTITSLAEELSKKEKAEVLGYLQIAAQYLRDTFSLTKAKILLEYIRVLQKQVNLRLTLEVMFMKVSMS